MNRIDLFEQIKAFDYMCITSLSPGITGNIRSVYFALLSINNAKYWSEVFEVDFQYILELSRVDKDTYRRAMDFLNSAGLFIIYEKGVNKYSRAKVSLKVLTEKPAGNAVGNTTSNTVGSTVSIAHINKTIDNKHKNIKTFEVPSIEDVRTYFDDFLKASPDEGERFFYHYESNGWLVGKNKMKNWHAACRNWLKKAEEFKKEKNSAQKEKDSHRGVKAALSWADVRMHD